MLLVGKTGGPTMEFLVSEFEKLVAIRIREHLNIRFCLSSLMNPNFPIWKALALENDQKNYNRIPRNAENSHQKPNECWTWITSMARKSCVNGISSKYSNLSRKPISVSKAMSFPLKTRLSRKRVYIFVWSAGVLFTNFPFTFSISQ